MRIKFLGSGDAFGSGGRMNACFFVDRGEDSFLIDCGASSMIAIRQFDVDPNTIGTILLSHLHGDHFGGLPFFILDGQMVSRRTRPLVIVGPQGLRTRLDALMDAMFPGSSQVERKFAIELVELKPEVPAMAGSRGPTVTGYPVVHPSGTPSLALRIECDGKVIAYTGARPLQQGPASALLDRIDDRREFRFLDLQSRARGREPCATTLA
jgi:ribonuclease BN (tRNA processing enzyme)